MNFPRYIYAIGGAGKNLVYRTLEKEWIVREILKPQFAPTEVSITIIDTALDEENSDRSRIAEIENNIRVIDEEYRSKLLPAGTSIGRINIEYKLLTEEMNLQSPHALIAMEEKVKKATGAKTWWINDSELGEDWSRKIMTKNNLKQLDFSKGVYRKRAMGKAIYYKAISENLFTININKADKIAVIIGFGGGTGSGIAFDLARTLKKIQPTADITLFGVLSTLSESSDEKTNSFAMLSELERAYINGNSYFNAVVLIPMEVTKFPGRETASDIQERLLVEFDETVPNIFVSYYDAKQGMFTDFPDFAPFCIANSQVVRYNVESIKKLKDDLIEALSDKNESLKAEEDIYKIIGKFVDEFYPEEFQKGLSEDDKSFIKERLSKFNMVIDHELFQELNYNGIVVLKNALHDGIVGSGSDEIEKQVSCIKSETDMMTVGDDGYREDTDKTLYDTLKRDIDNIDMLQSALNLVNNNVKDDLIRETLKIIVKADEGRSRNKLQKIRDEFNKLTIKRKQYESVSRTLEESVTVQKESAGTQVDSNSEEWKQNELKNIEHLDRIDAMVPVLNNDFSMLKNELNEYSRRVVAAKNAQAIDIEPTRIIEELTNKITLEMETIGLYYKDRSLIVSNLINLKEFKRAQIEFAKKVGFFDRTLGTNRVKRSKEAENKTRLKSAELVTDKVFDMGSNAISNIYDYDIGNKINGKKDEISDAMINRAKEKFPKGAPSLFSDLKGILKSKDTRGDVKIVDAKIREIVLSDIGLTTTIGKAEKDIKEKKNEMVRISKDINIFKTLENMITKDIKEILSSHVRHLKKYHDTIANMGKDVNAMHNARRDVVRYVADVQPTNIYKATVTGANINDIMADQGEELTLRQSIRDAANRTVDSRYNMLVRRVIENDEHKKRWSRSKVFNAFVTIANIDIKKIDTYDIITKAFDVAKIAEWQCKYGDSWSVGNVLFVTGVPLDNILSATDPSEGYYRCYEESEKNSLIFLHHSYMLEEGKYIQRKRMFNVENKEDKDMLLQDDNATITKTLSENYKEKKLVDVFKTESETT